jgi:hypothetical protein
MVMRVINVSRIITLEMENVSLVGKDLSTTYLQEHANVIKAMVIFLKVQMLQPVSLVITLTTLITSRTLAKPALKA